MALAACGGGSSSIAKATYLTKADSICTSFEKSSKTIMDAAPDEAAAKTAITTQVLPAFKTQIQDIKALGYPKGDKETLTSILDGANSVADAIAKDPQKFVTADTSPFDDINKKMQAYGFTVCGKADDAAKPAAGDSTAKASSLASSFGGDVTFTSSQKDCLVKEMMVSIGVSDLEKTSGIGSLSPDKQKAVIGALGKCLTHDEQVQMMVPQLTKNQTKLTAADASCYAGKLLDSLGLARLYDFGQGSKPTTAETTSVLGVMKACNIDPSVFAS